MIKINIRYWLIIFILTPYLLAAQTKQQSAISTFVKNPALKHASVGVCVKDMTGKTIASHNMDKALTPASILKIITTATALEVLGSEYTYRTTLAKERGKNNHLLIHGYGDPTLGTEYLDNTPEAFLPAWTNAIKSNIDSSNTLDITVIDNYFGYDGIAQRWTYQDIGNHYGAATYGISIYDNLYKVYFDTTRPDTCPVIRGTKPEIKSLNFHNTLTINKTGKDNGYIHGVPLSNERLLTGNIPSGKTWFSLKGDIPNPGQLLADVVATQLKSNGYNIATTHTTLERYRQQMHSKKKDAFDEEVFYSHKSYPMKEIVKDINYRSNNHYAEHVIRTIGRTKNADIYSSALDEGISKTKTLWKLRGLNTEPLTMFDGSGLSPSNAVSPAFMCELLVYMQAKSKNAKAFLESLPKAGKEGTVRYRLRGTRLAGKVYMKSGSIFGVRCFSGYYVEGAKKYAFTVMVNKYNGTTAQVNKAIDDLLLSLF
ncbi:D-alanyl-D-alanine carboxypeptidase/D-alanyl-D-alanine-endopeptidase [Dysgonomonas sp. 511]|uniref:D-alanyl-D-alanine carboxypeptidase/D-alanyl-D-alanine endopeptidase n=1 Tax=Dysgonomonas sp. 511 TaxID=2302930 RepID=UPI0013D13F99|nr:D-alanyl-D-alanine carboxypeptidase/D-alanyl-D-alanine-endopeptidase [Dysgonomonas sp. 511]NDV78387.1 D-alanyl-D-alanine carboxypeptidase/D-alanyl-D-alanine-endopeptidase [Dysgonomonas sp. 511]